jgi:hypothetical protein
VSKVVDADRADAGLGARGLEAARELEQEVVVGAAAAMVSMSAIVMRSTGLSPSRGEVWGEHWTPHGPRQPRR